MKESKDTKSIAGARQQNRRLILWLVCGGYLIYLSFELGRNLFRGEIPAGTETMVAWGACIAFGLIGLVLVVLSARTALRSLKGSVEAMEEAEAAGEEER